MSARKIDIYNHVMPRAVADLMQELAPSMTGMVKRVTSIPMLYDIEARIRMMEAWPGYQQVLTISNPPLEAIAGPGDSPTSRASPMTNSNTLRTRPDKFPAWVASLPLNNVEASLAEMDRAIAQGARGVQIFTNVNGMALDDPSLFPIFERATNHHHVGIWMHPARGARHADYPGEAKSKYEIWQVLGWPYETSVAMARIVFSGLSTDCRGEDRDPPFGGDDSVFEGRVGPLWDQLGTRTADEDYGASLLRWQPKADGRSIFRYSITTPRSAGHAPRSAAAATSSVGTRAVRDRLPVRPGRRADVYPGHDRRARWPIARRGGPGRNLFRNALKMLRLQEIRKEPLTSCDL